MPDPERTAGLERRDKRAKARVAASDERAWWIRSMGVHFGVETAFLCSAAESGGPQFAVVELQLVEQGDD